MDQKEDSLEQGFAVQRVQLAFELSGYRISMDHYCNGGLERLPSLELPWSYRLRSFANSALMLAVEALLGIEIMGSPS